MEGDGEGNMVGDWVSEKRIRAWELVLMKLFERLLLCIMESF